MYNILLQVPGITVLKNIVHRVIIGIEPFTGG